MFKAFGNLIHRTPWWGMILGGIATLAVLVLFTLPVQVIRLVDSGATPAENRAIQREIGLAVGSRALDLATGVITTLRERVTTPERRDEFERALAEIERARVELLRAQSAGYESVIESARGGRRLSAGNRHQRGGVGAGRCRRGTPGGGRSAR
jgi:hypothetical protein